jgi:MFS family permease
MYEPKLLPIMAAVFTSFVLVGLALPVLPLHLHQGLSFGAFVVGLVTGSQFIASLLSRVWAGSFADARGGKRAVIIGLVASFCAGLVYLASLAALGQPTVSMAALLVGRAMVGLGESFVITGAVAWGLTTLGGNHSGKVIAWIGTAMFAALALGAPLGTALYAAAGFAAIALATILLPIAILLAVLPIRGAEPAGSSMARSFMSVFGAVWLPGLGAALSSIGYGAILSFGALFFAQQGWFPRVASLHGLFRSIDRSKARAWPPA